MELPTEYRQGCRRCGTIVIIRAVVVDRVEAPNRRACIAETGTFRGVCLKCGARYISTYQTR